MGVTELSFELKLTLFLAGHIVAMVTRYIERMPATCLPMIGNLDDTICSITC